jgi:hypothetical protein
MRSLVRRGRLGLVCLTTALASLSVAGTASAAPSGVVTVTGTSVSTIELTLPDSTAQFGTNLTPDGVASNSTDAIAVNVDGATPSTGSCYEWGGSAVVRSNVTYKVSVTASASLPRLGFLTANPATFAACSSGEQASTAMFPSATPAGSFVINQAATSTRTHNFWLGMTVLWTDAPGNLNPAGVSLTLTASVYP